MSIIAGSVWIAIVAFFAFLIWAVASAFSMFDGGRPGYGMAFAVIGMALPFLAPGVIAIIGGAYARRQQHWRLAVAGAICALLVLPLGIPALVMLYQGKGDFANRENVPAQDAEP